MQEQRGFQNQPWRTSLMILSFCKSSNKFLLYAVGLGKGATPTAAAINWVLKDGIGYLSKIMLSKYGRHFDVHPKGWRLFADLLENAAFGLEMLTLAFPRHFVFIGAAAGAGRSASSLIQVVLKEGASKDSKQDMLKSLFQLNYLYWLGNNAGINSRNVYDDCRPGGKLWISLEYVQEEFNHVKSDSEPLGNNPVVAGS